MKRIWSAIGKNAKNATYQRKAVQQFEKIQSGKVKVSAPKVPTEEKRFAAAQNDEMIRKELAAKHEDLVDNMNKIKITSKDPPPRPKSDKALPTRESEWMHRNDPVWEYGFYEPPEEKIPKGKLMFREAVEVLSLMQILSDAPKGTNAEKHRQDSTEKLNQMKVVERVEKEKLDEIFEYFRPFVRRESQKVVNQRDLSALQDYLQGHSQERKLTDGAKDHVRELIQNKIAREEYDRLEEEEQRKFQDAVKQLRQEEFERLEKRMSTINKVEEGIKQAASEAQANAEKEKK